MEFSIFKVFSVFLVFLVILEFFVFLEHHGCAADKSAATARCYHVNMDQNL